MASVFDVAAYILEKQPPLTHMKLQKLVYYSQAWSLVWDEEPIFDEPIEAWINGPVVRSLYAQLRQLFKVRLADLTRGKLDNLTPPQCETVDAVLDTYGPKSSQWLSDLTHMELPWKEARKGLSANERGTREISHAIMAEYYGSL
ncbi:MAG: type II toxin-antitoxin system antitoxin SocA domain-containing protein [Thermoguttaceae bacterium]